MLALGLSKIVPDGGLWCVLLLTRWVAGFDIVDDSMGRYCCASSGGGGTEISKFLASFESVILTGSPISISANRDSVSVLVGASDSCMEFGAVGLEFLEK